MWPEALVLRPDWMWILAQRVQCAPPFQGAVGDSLPSFSLAVLRKPKTLTGVLTPSCPPQVTTAVVVRVGPLSPDRVACRRPLVCHRPTNPRRANNAKGAQGTCALHVTSCLNGWKGKNHVQNQLVGLQPVFSHSGSECLPETYYCTGTAGRTSLSQVRNRASSGLGDSPAMEHFPPVSSARCVGLGLLEEV